MQVQTNIAREAYDQGILNKEKLETLIQSRGEASVDQLTLVLQDDDPLLRAIALIYLGKTGDQRAVAPILRFIHDDSRYAMYNPRHTPLWERIVRRFSPYMHELRDQICKDSRRLDLRHAANALVTLGSADAAETLQFLSNDADEAVRTDARAALARLEAS